MSLKNKVAIITGSGSGIGAATALLFAEEGAHVVIVDKNEAGAKNTGKQIENIGKKSLIITADLNIQEQAKEIIPKTIDVYGKLNILVNNAAIVRVGNILDGNIMKTYDEVMKNNLRTMVLMTSLAAPHLIESKGAIVNVSSVASFSSKYAMFAPTYCIAKAGVNAFTQSTARELAAAGVRVNAVLPGPVNTNIAASTEIPVNMTDYVEQAALRRMSEPREIADLLVYLASDKARSVTGSCYVIDNGILLT